MPRFSLPWRRKAAEPSALSCRELVRLVSDYLDGALSGVDERRFEGHIAGCEGCTMYLDQMRDTLELLGRLTPDSISPEAERELTAAFRDWHAGA
jgi:predicted anti-sigma-YlaC factor YlaD